MILLKIITICGSLKFMDEMMIKAEQLVLEGYCVLTPVYPVIKDIDISDKQLQFFKEAHFRKIELSDAIYVFNKNQYIGESTKLEIEYAQKLKKEIMYDM